MSDQNDSCPSGSETRGVGDFDLAVIGGGSAGFSASIRATELGARVALIGHGTLGGTCVNVGCVPSKTLVRAAETLHRAASAQRFAGIAAHAALANWNALREQKDELVAAMRQAKYADLLPAYDGIAYLDGPARLVPGGVEANGSVVKAEKVVIATGSTPAVPEIDGISDVPYLTSTTAMELAALPESLLVIGAGYIGCELGQVFARFGVDVTLVCRRRLLPEAEPEIGAALTGYFEAEGIAVRAGAAYRHIRLTPNGVALTLEMDGAESVIEAGNVLVATGRRANTEGLGLAEAGVGLTARGGIEVDECMRTSRPATYAAGDVTGRDEFVYMAAYGAKLAVENALDGDARRYDASAMPAVVFTDPQAASVGLSERSAHEQGFDAATSILPLDQLPRALAARDTRGLIKLVADKNTGRLLGAHILAPEGADAIQTAVLAIKQGLSVTELANTIFPFLTTVEGLKLAALGFGKDIRLLSCCAG